MNEPETLFTFEGELEFLQERFDWGGYGLGGEPELLPDALHVQDSAGEGLVATLQVEGVDPERARPLDGQRVRVSVERI